jgi:hypothetical protein
VLTGAVAAPVAVMMTPFVFFSGEVAWEGGVHRGLVGPTVDDDISACERAKAGLEPPFRPVLDLLFLLVLQPLQHNQEVLVGDGHRIKPLIGVGRVSSRMRRAAFVTLRQSSASLR